MTQASLGLIETVGLAAAIEAADAALKSANVVLMGYELTRGDGMAVVKVQGEVGAVNAAVAAGVAAAAKVGRVAGCRVIARPARGIERFVDNAETVGSPSATAVSAQRGLADPQGAAPSASSEDDGVAVAEAPAALEPPARQEADAEDLSGTSAESVSASDARNPEARDSLVEGSVQAPAPDHRDAVSPSSRLADEKLPIKNRKQRKTKE